MGFQDLDALLDDTLPLPIGGKVYRVPPADAALGLWCQRMISAGLMIQSGQKPPSDIPPLDLDDDDETALYRRLLGSVFDELMTDNVNWPKIQIVGQTAFLWVGSGRELAEQFWNSGGDPEAFPPRRQPSKASTRTAGGNTTRKRASMSGTKSRKTS